MSRFEDIRPLATVVDYRISQVKVPRLVPMPGSWKEHWRCAVTVRFIAPPLSRMLRSLTAFSVGGKGPLASLLPNTVMLGPGGTGSIDTPWSRRW